MNVVVIGAGIAGLASAWELQRNGCSVTVIDRIGPGAGATGAAAGMLAPVAEASYGEDAHVRLGIESLALWPDFAAELERASGLEIDYRTEGTLIVAVDRDDLAWVNHNHDLHRALGLRAELIDGDQAREREPSLAPGVPGAVYCPDDHQMDPPRLVDALVEAFTREGGRLITDLDVRGMIVRDGRVVDLDCDGFDAPSDGTYVVAAGAWLRKLEGLGADRPAVRPVRGQMVAVQLGEPAVCTHVIRGPDAYLVPKSDGRLLIGATMEEVGFDVRQTAGGVMDLLVGAWELIPGVHELHLLSTWAGLRPMTVDNNPVLRRSATLRNVVYAAGHGRNGILLAPLTAQRVAGLVGVAPKS